MSWYSLKSEAPATNSLHSVAFSSLPKTHFWFTGCLSTSVYPLGVQRQGTLSQSLCAMLEYAVLWVTLCHNGVCGALCELPLTRTASYFPQTPLIPCPQGLHSHLQPESKTQAFSVFNFPFKSPKISVQLSAFCIFLPSHLYFSKQRLLLPVCY